MKLIAVSCALCLLMLLSVQLAPADTSGAPLVGAGSTPAQDPRCSMPPNPGPCKGLFEIYYYDQTKESCQPAMYGGCEGVVPFETMDECRAACMAGKE